MKKTSLADLERSSTTNSIAATSDSKHSSLNPALTHLAGHAQNDMVEDTASKNPGTPNDKVWDDDVEDDDDSEKYRKLYNRMDAKLRRICEPKAKSGKVDADPALVADWKKKGHTRTQLVKLMIEAHGDKDCAYVLDMCLRVCFVISYVAYMCWKCART